MQYELPLIDFQGAHGARSYEGTPYAVGDLAQKTMTYTDTELGVIGIMLSGAGLFNHLDATGAVAYHAEGDTLDSCYGHAAPSLGALSTDSLFGWNLLPKGKFIGTYHIHGFAVNNSKCAHGP